MSGRRDLVVVGMGSAGMVAAEFAATLGLRVSVVEAGRVGGDCLWTGCVPSKALLASAKAAHVMRTGHVWGLPDLDPVIDTAKVWDRLRSVQAAIAASDDNPARFEALDVEIIRGRATLTGPHTVRVEDASGARTDLETRFVLVCTGSRPDIPGIPGLTEAGYLTSESVFELDRAPESVAFIGGGPIAVELAQAFTRLGVAATVLQKGPGILGRDEPELVATLTAHLRAEGVDIRCGVTIDDVTVADNTGGAAGGRIVRGSEAGAPEAWPAQALLVAAGRRPNVEGLGLAEIGVGIGRRGVEVDERMRTVVPSVYAAGDLAGRYLFTHSAGHEAVRAVRDMFFPGKGTVTTLIPWCTFTDPELAHVGLTSIEAEQRFGDDVEVWRLDLTHSDRARADGADGAIVVITAKHKIVGGHILAPGAGELIHELALAIHHGLRLDDLAFVHVYPTLSTSIGHLAAEAAIEKAKRLRWLVRKEKP